MTDSLGTIARCGSFLPDFKSRVSVATCFIEDSAGRILLLRRSATEE